MTVAEMPDHLFLKAGYRSRSTANYFVDDATDSEGVVHQPDVYPMAAHLARHYEANCIIDVGCGRADKLMQYANEFQVVGIDTGVNIAHCRDAYAAGVWFDVDLEVSGCLPLSNEQLTGSVIVCSDVIEHLVDPRPLLRELARLRKYAAAIVISTPDRDRARGPDDFGPPGNPFHIREWNIHELGSLLASSGLETSFIGFTMNNDSEWRKNTILAIVEGTQTPPLESAPDNFRVVAVVTAYNERDMVPFTIQRLLDQGLEVILVDNWSTDGTFEVARALFSDRAQIVRFPDADTGTFDWSALLDRVVAIGRQSAADWVIHHDADEVREGPWPGVNLRDSIYHVQCCGFNAVNHAVIEFRPVVGEPPAVEGTDPAEGLRWWEHLSHEANLVQVKAWKNDGQPVDLAASGGHEARFAGRRIFPYKFLLRHYPLRSPEHARRKVFKERMARWNARERELGWHTHYDGMTPADTFLWPTEALTAWTPDTFQKEFLTERLAGIGVLRGLENEWVDQVDNPRATMQSELRSAEQERDVARAERERIASELRRVTDLLTEEQRRRAVAQDDAAHAERVLRMVMESASWRAMEPLRTLMSAARKWRGRSNSPRSPGP